MFFLSSSGYERLPGVVEELQLWGKATCSSEQMKGMKHMFLEQVEIFLIVEKRELLPQGYYFSLERDEEPRCL